MPRGVKVMPGSGGSQTCATLPQEGRWTGGRSLVVLVCGIVPAVSAILLFFAWLEKTSAEVELDRVHRLRVVMEILTDYYRSFGRFPPTTVYDSDGKPMYGWRGTVGAYADGVPLSQIEELSVMQTEVPASSLYCWEEDAWGRLKSDTSVLAVTGPGTFFSLENPQMDSDFVWDAIVLIQTVDSGIHWLQPGDLAVDDLPVSLTEGIGDDGMFVVFLDGETWRLGKDVPNASIVKFLTLEGAKKYDRDELLGPFAAEKYMRVEGTSPLLWHRKAFIPEVLQNRTEDGSANSGKDPDSRCPEQ